MPKKSKSKESKSKDSKTKKSKRQCRRAKVDQAGFPQSCLAPRTSEVTSSPSDSFTPHSSVPKVASERESPKRQLQAAIAHGKASQVRALLLSHPWLLQVKYLKLVTKANRLPPNPRQEWPNQIEHETVCHHYSPLHLAAIQGRAKIVQVLLECGADVMATTGPPEKRLPPHILRPDLKHDGLYHDNNSNLIIDNEDFNNEDFQLRPPIHLSHLTSEPTSSHLNDSNRQMPFRSNRTMHLPLYYAVLPDELLSEVLLPEVVLPDADGGGDDRGYLRPTMPSARMRVARLLLKRMRQVVAEEWFYDLTLAETIEQVICDTNNANFQNTNSWDDDSLNDDYLNDEPFDAIFAMEVLHGAQANWEVRDRQGFTALHQAVIWENIVAYEWLIENGADPNPTNNTGNTPLHLALWWGSDPMLLAVLRSPCDPLLPNNMGVSPYDMVLRSGCPVLRELFEAHPAIQKHQQNQMDKGNQTEE